MTRTLDTAAAARLAGTAVRTIRAWCRRGLIAAVKTGRRWTVGLASLLRRLNAGRPAVTDRLRAGEQSPVRTGRAGRRYEARHAARVEAVQRRTRDENPKRGARPATHVQRAVCLASPGMTARAYLLAIGCNKKFVAQYESAFGRAVAKVYREAHGCEPERAARVVLRGQVWSAFTYDEQDLYAGAVAYPRTAALLSNRRNAALAELTAV